tara:strand:- start:1150 stop:2322 length:1173 start_codon:yes stop_codon:yes gene_type:complete
VTKDLVAGTTTGVVLVAQAVAYSALAGLPPTAGLYAALVAPLLYAAIGRSVVLAAGPTAISSLLVGQALAGMDDLPVLLAHAALLAGLVGVVQLVAATVRLHRLAKYITPVVLVGFLAGAAVRIVLTQLEHLATHRGAFHIPTAGIGLSAVVLLMLPLPAKLEPFKALRTVAVMIGYTVLCFFFAWDTPTIGRIPAGLPMPALPWAGEGVEFASLAPLAAPAALIALLSFIEGIGASAARPQELRPGRELVALGAANLAASFARGYPVSGGLSRTAVNANSGAQTRWAGVVSSGVVVLVLLVGSPLLAPMPTAILAAVVTAGVISLIDVPAMREADRRRRWVIAVTALGTFALGVGVGIGLGVATELMTRRWGPWPKEPFSRRSRSEPTG